MQKTAALGILQTMKGSPKGTPSHDERHDMAARLRAAGVAPTAQRRRIAEVLLAFPRHLSADQVLGLVNLRGAPVSKATVYNTLKLFLDRGLVKEVIVDPQR